MSIIGGVVDISGWVIGYTYFAADAWEERIGKMECQITTKIASGLCSLVPVFQLQSENHRENPCLSAFSSSSIPSSSDS